MGALPLLDMIQEGVEWVGSPSFRQAEIDVVCAQLAEAATGRCDEVHEILDREPEKAWAWAALTCILPYRFVYRELAPPDSMDPAFFEGLGLLASRVERGPIRHALRSAPRTVGVTQAEDQVAACHHGLFFTTLVGVRRPASSERRVALWCQGLLLLDARHHPVGPPSIVPNPTVFAVGDDIEEVQTSLWWGSYPFFLALGLLSCQATLRPPPDQVHRVGQGIIVERHR